MCKGMHFSRFLQLFSMPRNAYFKYNPLTNQYERVYPTAKQRWWAVLRHLIIGAVIATGLFCMVYYVFDLPKERALREENEHLLNRVEELGRQADVAISVMEDIAARDNNFFRVMMQADPVTDARRYAGIERRRKNLTDSTSDADAIVEAVAAKLDRLDYQVYSQIKSFDELRELALSQHERIANIPAIQPVPESELRQMASGYGYRRDPVYGTTKFHEGMDFACPVGTSVYATGRGKVIFAGWKSGYGNVIEIDHGFQYVTRYAHLSKIDVKEGQSVERGELIGAVGNTGKSTGPHLHYEVRYRGQPRNPVNYYYYDLTPEQYDEMIRMADNAGHVMD